MAVRLLVFNAGFPLRYFPKFQDFSRNQLFFRNVFESRLHLNLEKIAADKSYKYKTTTTVLRPFVKCKLNQTHNFAKTYFTYSFVNT